MHTDASTMQETLVAIHLGWCKSCNTGNTCTTDTIQWNWLHHQTVCTHQC